MRRKVIITFVFGVLVVATAWVFMASIQATAADSQKGINVGKALQEDPHLASELERAQNVIFRLTSTGLPGIVHVEFILDGEHPPGGDFLDALKLILKNTEVGVEKRVVISSSGDPEKWPAIKFKMP